MNKKSYMNVDSILNESFFTKLAGAIGKLRRKKLPKSKLQSQFQNDINDFNDSIDAFEKSFNKLYGGTPVKFNKLTINDFK